MPDVLRGSSLSPRCTAQVADGLLTILPEFPEAEPAARMACQWLCSRWQRAKPLGDSAHPWSSECDEVLPLLRAGRLWPQTGWLLEAQSIVDAWAGPRETPSPQSVCCSQSSARRVETLIAMGREETARAVMGEVATLQKGNGGLRVPGGTLRTARLAQLAALWYKLGEQCPADAALVYLQRKQRPGGEFPAIVGAWPRAASRAWDAWAAKYYLDAALLRVEVAFQACWQQFPDAIDPVDGRMEAARRWMATLPMAARVADVGCGKGRFLRHLKREFPAADFLGLDVSPAMLSFLPPGVPARKGSILRTGLADGALDGALTVETLEHCLVPRRAIAELCRIVRPGGRVLVIDKDRRKQPLSEHDPWERWVTAGELSKWLAPFCEDIEVFHVHHREGRPASDLFLAATATRRSSPACRQSAES